MPTVLTLLDFVPNQERTFETFLLRLCRALREEGWQQVFVFSGEPSDAFAAQLRAEGAHYRVGRFPLERADADALIASLAQFSPLVMTNAFVSCFSPFLLNIKKRLGIKYWLVHDESSGIASTKSGIRRQLAKLRGRYYGKNIDRVLAVSEFVARRNAEESFLPADRIKVLRNGVDLSRFHPSVAPTSAECAAPRVAFVGQLIPEKGIRTLLQAMRLLKERPVPVTPALDVAGQGALEEELRAYASEHGLHQVRFLGQVADVAELYRAASVVVVPSEWAEACAFVISEAMACGACVLASDAGGNPDMVGREEAGGRLFRSGDAHDLAEKLLGLLDDPIAQSCLRKRARIRAECLFGLDGMVKDYVRELQDVARGGRRGGDHLLSTPPEPAGSRSWRRPGGKDVVRP